MHRILLTAALLAAAPACVFAQAAGPKADASSPAATAPRKSHNPFGAAIQELTRAAREQQAATKAAGTATGAARDEQKTSTTPAATAPAAAPALADSNRS